MIVITDVQKQLLLKYVDIELTDDTDIDEVLDLLDDKITEIGFDDKQEWLNPVGHDLQLLYDALYSQN